MFGNWQRPYRNEFGELGRLLSAAPLNHVHFEDLKADRSNSSAPSVLQPAFAVRCCDPGDGTLLATHAMLDRDAAQAAILLQRLMAERPVDPAVRRLAERVSPMQKSDLPPTRRTMRV